ncbi:MAG: hypothetical protein RIR12_750 [Bacteroidota bacterium]|jgi:8-oxo-dGTP pyrophosphatase MutT (NUDIX family)
MHWSVQSSEYLYKHPPYFIARKDKCIKPDGTPVEAYYVVEIPDSVIVFGITSENKAVFVQQYRHPVQQLSYELPGGFIDEGEEPIAAAKREAAEETGYAFKNYQYLGKVAGNPGILNNFTHIFLAEGGEKTMDTKLDAQEDIRTFLFDIAEIKKLMQENKIIQSLHLNACYMALEKVKY